MALEELLDDAAVVLDPRAIDLCTATEATYVFTSEMIYEYPAPIRALRHRFVVLPRGRHGDQRRIVHRVHADVPRRASVRRRYDRFGNLVVEVCAAEVDRRFSVGVRAVLRRRRSASSGRQWRTSHSAPTALTTVDGSLRAAAERIAAGTDGLAAARAIGEAVHGAMTYQLGVTGVRTSASDAWALGRGVCQDMAHVMIAMCRARGLEARYVSGHLVGDGASHAWVEVRDGLDRMLAYDPTHARETDLRYVTVAVGRDDRDVAPTAGTYRSGPRGHLTVRKRVGITAVR